MRGKTLRIRQLLIATSLSLALLIAIRLSYTRRPLPDHGNTWSIVAADSQSGSVGIAAASCFPRAIDAIAALVPGQGVAATQADFNLGNRNQVFELLQEGLTAEEIVAQVSALAADPDAARRQYGVVTLAAGSVQVAGFSGGENVDWAGDRQDEDAAVSVQGNFLEGEAVVSDALAAFQAAKEAGDPLHERLMEALEAGSAAGGDRRCNQNGMRQTASAAMIMVADPEQPPFVVRALGETEVGQADSPALYLSATEPEGGDNAVNSLREQYDSWLEETPEGFGTLATPLLALIILAVLIVPIALLLMRRRGQNY